jgi:GNAT superfamily N-acetyltransferase
MSSEIRPATANDSTAIGQLIAEMGYTSTPGKINEILLNLLDNPDQQLFVARVDDQLAAYIHLMCARDIADKPGVEIVAFNVHPKFRRIGLGKQLLVQSEQWALSRQCPYLRIRAAMIRDDAQPFFFNHGFAFLRDKQIFLHHVEADGAAV